jgi:hypothetical protein
MVKTHHSAHLTQYAHACFEGGYSWVADLADHSVEELEEKSLFVGGG